LWNKNRALDVCDPTPVLELAMRWPNQKFLTTFYPHGENAPRNVTVTGILPHDKMAPLVKSAEVYLATTKETFGIGILEAMASGIPVLGFRHGAAVNLIRHGVNGYLAEPGDFDELAAGLNYCLEHARTLGANGREIARAYTWERVAEQVVALYEQVLRPEPPTVSVIIPCFNYGTEDKLGRAIQSVLAQSFGGLTRVIVVDDGSADPRLARNLVEHYRSQDGRIKLVETDHRGVASARNIGIAECSSKYICCLDADDAIEPMFLQVCITELERDASLGIAYTRLQWVTPDGKRGVSDWPGDCDPDAQIAGHNQVPTCCVFRRDMWERLGGYNPRYCPRGAGEEDAEFWLRAIAYGWGAKRASEEALFVYSQGSGRVSGDRKHKETNWRLWHPWTRDNVHPFASLAKPKRQSHPVRQYDRPEISVIIPVGPGHENELRTALDSLEAQEHRKWEAIVVWDSPDTNPIISERRTQRGIETTNLGWLNKAYPYVRLVVQPGLGYDENGFKPIGSGAARNAGAKIARAPLLLFLDADDYLTPDALGKMLQAWRAYGAAVYTDYVGIAFVSDVSGLAPNLQARVYERDEGDGRTVIGYQAFDYDCERAQRQPEDNGLYLWNLVTTLHPKTWWEEAGGMDESLKTWEDIDYWWRLARMGKCFIRLPEELVVYQFGTGHRRESGVSSQAEMISLLKQSVEKVNPMGCGSCSKRKAAIAPPAPPQQMGMSPNSALKGYKDEEFVLCLYNSPNQGEHPIVGGVTKIRYGYRVGGDVFLVHVLDMDVQPQFFIPAPEQRAEPAAPPPAPVTLPGVVELDAPIALTEIDLKDTRSKTAMNVDYDALPGVTTEQIAAMRLTFTDKILYSEMASLSDDFLASVGNIGLRKARQIIAYSKKHVA
jgi:glycosyltransferase involved in cell wall biosynthesis